MIGICPDLAFGVVPLFQFSECSRSTNWNAIKQELRCINRSRDLGILFSVSTLQHIYWWCDSEWADITRNRESTSENIFMLVGGATKLCSCKQSVVATSTWETEHIRLSPPWKDPVWPRRLLLEIVCNSRSRITFSSDSQSAIKLSQNGRISHRNYHTDETSLLARGVDSKGKLRLEYKSTTEMEADALTKPLGRVPFSYTLKVTRHRARRIMVWIKQEGASVKIRIFSKRWTIWIFLYG